MQDKTVPSQLIPEPTAPQPTIDIEELPEEKKHMANFSFDYQEMISDPGVRVDSLVFVNKIKSEESAQFTIQRNFDESESKSERSQRMFSEIKRFDEEIRAAFGHHFFPNFPSLPVITIENEEQMQSLRLSMQFYLHKLSRYKDLKENEHFKALLSQNTKKTVSIFGSLIGGVSSVITKTKSKLRDKINFQKPDREKVKKFPSMNALIELEESLKKHQAKNSSIIDRIEEIRKTFKINEEIQKQCYISDYEDMNLAQIVSRFITNAKSVYEAHKEFEKQIREFYLVCFVDMGRDIDCALDLIRLREQLRYSWLVDPKKKGVKEYETELDEEEANIHKELEQFINCLNQNQKNLVEDFIVKYDDEIKKPKNK